MINDSCVIPRELSAGYGTHTGLLQMKGDQTSAMNYHDLNEDARGNYIYIDWSYDYVD